MIIAILVLMSFVTVYLDVNKNNEISQLKERIEKIEIEAKYGTLPSPTEDFPDDPRLNHKNKFVPLDQ